MLPDINLLPKYEKERSLLYILFVIGLMVAFFLTGFLIYQYITVKDELKQVAAHNEELIALKEALQVQAANQEPNEKELLEEAVVYAEKYVVPTSRLIDQLIMFLPSTGYMSKYEYREGKVAIEPHFETMTDSSAYVAKLDTSDFIKNVQVNRIETFELDEPEVTTEDETENLPKLNPFELLPRYQVTYSFEINSAQLKKETEENE